MKMKDKFGYTGQDRFNYKIQEEHFGSNDITAEIITTNRFQILSRKRIEIGGFYFSRLVWNFFPEGGRAWQQGLFIFMQLLFQSLALPVDIVIGILSFTYKAAIEILKWVLGLLSELLKVLFKSVFGTALKWILVPVIIFIFYIVYDTGLWSKLYQILHELLSQYL